MTTITNEDCMKLMARYEDKYFDLAVCDPPFGIGEEWKKRRFRRSKGHPFPETTYKNNTIPPLEYFLELFRVSKDAIIFGYNYFTEILGPTNYLIVWDKCSNNNGFINYSQAEIAYTSTHKPIQVFSVPWDGYCMGKESGTKKIHPHQKPIELYVKILRKYAKPGFKILDTHMGSGSSVLACNKLGLDVWTSEIDPFYYAQGKKRIDLEICQRELFSVEERVPLSLFDCA